jgi:urea transport system permease protein
VFALLWLALQRTRLGLEVRAVAQNRAMARAMGVRSARVDALTFGLGSGIAGVAGVALSQLTNVGPNLGQSYIVDSFMVVVFGGVGNLWGTMVAGCRWASPTSCWNPGPARCWPRFWCWCS